MAYQIEYTIECLPEDMPIEGNASAIDDETDSKIESEIRAQLEAGNDWAWCCVRVCAVAYDDEGNQIARGKDYLGGCSYANEEDFKAGGYYEDMQAVALEECESEIARIRRAVCA